MASGTRDWVFDASPVNIAHFQTQCLQRHVYTELEAIEAVIRACLNKHDCADFDKSLLRDSLLRNFAPFSYHERLDNSTALQALLKIVHCGMPMFQVGAIASISAHTFASIVDAPLDMGVQLQQTQEMLGMYANFADQVLVDLTRDQRILHALVERVVCGEMSLVGAPGSESCRHLLDFADLVGGLSAPHVSPRITSFFTMDVPLAEFSFRAEDSGAVVTVVGLLDCAELLVVKQKERQAQMDKVHGFIDKLERDCCTGDSFALQAALFLRCIARSVASSNGVASMRGSVLVCDGHANSSLARCVHSISHSVALHITVETGVGGIVHGGDGDIATSLATGKLARLLPRMSWVEQVNANARKMWEKMHGCIGREAIVCLAFEASGAVVHSMDSCKRPVLVVGSCEDEECMGMIAMQTWTDVCASENECKGSQGIRGGMVQKFAPEYGELLHLHIAGTQDLARAGCLVHRMPATSSCEYGTGDMSGAYARLVVNGIGIFYSLALDDMHVVRDLVQGITRNAVFCSMVLEYEAVENARALRARSVERSPVSSSSSSASSPLSPYPQWCSGGGARGLHYLRKQGQRKTPHVGWVPGWCRHL